MQGYGNGGFNNGYNNNMNGGNQRSRDRPQFQGMDGNMPAFTPQMIFNMWNNKNFPMGSSFPQQQQQQQQPQYKFDYITPWNGRENGNGQQNNYYDYEEEDQDYDYDNENENDNENEDQDQEQEYEQPANGTQKEEYFGAGNSPPKPTQNLHHGQNAPANNHETVQPSSLASHQQSTNGSHTNITPNTVQNGAQSYQYNQPAYLYHQQASSLPVITSPKVPNPVQAAPQTTTPAPIAAQTQQLLAQTANLPDHQKQEPQFNPGLSASSLPQQSASLPQNGAPKVIISPQKVMHSEMPQASDQYNGNQGQNQYYNNNRMPMANRYQNNNEADNNSRYGYNKYQNANQQQHQYPPSNNRYMGNNNNPRYNNGNEGGYSNHYNNYNNRDDNKYNR